jgi:hypothetical protein
MPFAVRQGRQSRDAVAVRKEQLGRYVAFQSKYNRLYLHSGKLALASMGLRKFCVVGRGIVEANVR